MDEIIEMIDEINAEFDAQTWWNLAQELKADPDITRRLAGKILWRVLHAHSIHNDPVSVGD